MHECHLHFTIILNRNGAICDGISRPGFFYIFSFSVPPQNSVSNGNKKCNGTLCKICNIITTRAMPCVCVCVSRVHVHQTFWIEFAFSRRRSMSTFMRIADDKLVDCKRFVCVCATSHMQNPTRVRPPTIIAAQCTVIAVFLGRCIANRTEHLFKMAIHPIRERTRGRGWERERETGDMRQRFRAFKSIWWAQLITSLFVFFLLWFSHSLCDVFVVIHVLWRPMCNLSYNRTTRNTLNFSGTFQHIKNEWK